MAVGSGAHSRPMGAAASVAAAAFHLGEPAVAGHRVRVRQVLVDLAIEAGAAEAPPTFIVTCVCLRSATAASCSVATARIAQPVLEAHDASLFALGMVVYDTGEDELLPGDCLLAAATTLVALPPDEPHQEPENGRSAALLQLILAEVSPSRFRARVHLAKSTRFTP